MTDALYTPNDGRDIDLMELVRVDPRIRDIKSGTRAEKLVAQVSVDIRRMADGQESTKELLHELVGLLRQLIARMPAVGGR